MIQGSGTDTVKNISFYLQLAAGGNSVDMSKVGYTISTSKKVQTVQGTAPTVSYSFVKEISSGNLLENREMALIYLDIATMGWTNADVTLNDKILVEVKPPIGAALPISRTVPAAVANNNWYEVY